MRFQFLIPPTWMGVLTGSHQLLENQGAITVATKGATTTNATSGEILSMAARFQNGDYGDIPNEHDRATATATSTSDT